MKSKGRAGEVRTLRCRDCGTRWVSGQVRENKCPECGGQLEVSIRRMMDREEGRSSQVVTK